MRPGGAGMDGRSGETTHVVEQVLLRVMREVVCLGEGEVCVDCDARLGPQRVAYPPDT